MPHFPTVEQCSKVLDMTKLGSGHLNHIALNAPYFNVHLWLRYGWELCAELGLGPPVVKPSAGPKNRDTSCGKNGFKGQCG